jgi:hypothetical protein
LILANLWQPYASSHDALPTIAQKQHANVQIYSEHHENKLQGIFCGDYVDNQKVKKPTHAFDVSNEGFQ